MHTHRQPHAWACMHACTYAHLMHAYTQENVHISNNKASDGAGIHVDGGLVTLRDSVSLTDNAASGYLGGGALYLKGSVLMTPNTTVALTLQNNQGKSGACVRAHVHVQNTYTHVYTL
jgi:hypothetical protein